MLKIGSLIHEWQEKKIENIRKRAYLLWEADGCPWGKSEYYWHQAKATWCLSPWLSVLPILFWLLVVVFRILTESQVETQIANALITHKYDLAKTLYSKYSLPSDTLEAKIIAQMGAQFAIFVVLTGTYLLICFTILISSIVIIAQSTRENRAAFKIKLFSLLLLLILFIILIPICRNFEATNLTLKWKDLDEFLDKVDCYNVLKEVRLLSDCATIIGFVVVFALIGTACACLFPQVNYNTSAISSHRKQVQQLDLVLFQSAFLMVFSIVRVKSYFHFVDAFVMRSEGSSPSAISILSDLTNTVNGIYFTLTIFGIYMPAAYILYLRSLHYARTLRRTKNYVAQKKWLKKNSLEFNLFKSISKTAVILSPVFVGSASEIFKAITGSIS